MPPRAFALASKTITGVAAGQVSDPFNVEDSDEIRGTKPNYLAVQNNSNVKIRVRINGKREQVVPLGTGKTFELARELVIHTVEILNDGAAVLAGDGVDVVIARLRDPEAGAL